jgi:hypothetical protein
VNGAVGVSLVAPVTVAFSEAIDPVTLTETSFRILAGGVPVAGTRTLENNNAQARFTPSAPYPAGVVITIELTSAIADPFGNPLAANDGSPLSAPLTFSFTTSTFSITSPSGTTVIENRALLLEARASATSGIASVIFTVNGQALPAVTSPFSRTINVGSAASTPTLLIVASGRDAAGVEIARDERTVSVVVGITVAPTLTGVPVGGTSRLRFSLSSPLATDLPITLEAGDQALVGFTVNPVVLPAGQTFVDAEVRGLGTGATAVIGRSDRGTAAAIVASSPLTPGMTMETSPVVAGVAASRAAYGGYAVLPGGTTVSRLIQLLHVPASVETAVSVLSLNSSVASATIGPISAGSTSATLQITGLADGIATLLVRVGDHVRAIEVFVGTPAPDATLLLAPVTGTALSNAAFAGQVVVGLTGSTSISIPVLTTPSVGTTDVAVSSLNPSVATGSAGAITAGATSATITVNGVSAGTTTLLVRAGDQVRAITVTVGTPAPGTEPLTVSSPVGLSLAAIPTAGRFFVPATVSRTLGVTLFTSPVPSDTAVTVTSSNPAVVAVASPAIVGAGGRVVELQLTTGESGIAILTLEGGGLRRQIAVSVGTAPTPETTPPIVAAPVGISVIPNPSIGRLFGTPGVVSSSTIGLPLLASPAGAPVQVSVRTSNSAVVLVGGAASTTVTIAAGEQVASIVVGLTGTEGAALLTIEFNGERRELLVVVGTPPASEIPAVTAPIVGVKVGG